MIPRVLFYSKTVDHEQYVLQVTHCRDPVGTPKNGYSVKTNVYNVRQSCIDCFANMRTDYGHA